MRVFDLLSLLTPEATPAQSKVHLATWNGQDNPLSVYLAGDFAQWQSWQSRRNFERKFVMSLIQLPRPNQWLFAGLYVSNGAMWLDHEGAYRYDLEEDGSCATLSGRLVAHFARTGRQPYLNGETCSDSLLVGEILAERLSIGAFPGFRGIDLSRSELRSLFRHVPESWRSALSSVAGIYLIADNASGKLYVGAAYGAGGIWQRWLAYAQTGHGGNVELMALLANEGEARAETFRYSVLEIADIHTSLDDIRSRETHWKNVLLTRSHGLNSN